MPEIADLIAAQTRVRVGKVEGFIVSCRRAGGAGTVVLNVDGVEQTVALGVIEELEPVDPAKVAAYHQAADAAAARVDSAVRAAAAKSDLAALDDATFATVMADPAVARRLPAAPSTSGATGGIRAGGR